MATIESTIETYFCKKSKEAGVLCLKFISPGNSGVPDRILLKQGGTVGFAELKRPGARPRPLQTYWLAVLKRMGFKTYVVDTKEAADAAISDFTGTSAWQMR